MDHHVAVSAHFCTSNNNHRTLTLDPCMLHVPGTRIKQRHVGMLATWSSPWEAVMTSGTHDCMYLRTVPLLAIGNESCIMASAKVGEQPSVQCRLEIHFPRVYYEFGSYGSR